MRRLSAKPVVSFVLFCVVNLLSFSSSVSAYCFLLGKFVRVASFTLWDISFGAHL